MTAVIIYAKITQKYKHKQRFGVDLRRSIFCSKKVRSAVLLALLFLQRVRIARNADHCNSQGLSVCLSVTFRCFVQTNARAVFSFRYDNHSGPRDRQR